MDPIIVKETGWNFNDLTRGKSFGEKRKIWKEETDKFISKWKNREDYLKDPNVLKEALGEFERWAREYGSSGDEYYYYWLKGNQNQEDSGIKAGYNKVEEFGKGIENIMSFFTLNISKISKEKQNNFLEDPSLKEYEHFLRNLFKKSKHLLSENEERIMNLKSSSAHELWVKMISEFLSKEEIEVLVEDNKKAVKNFSNLPGLMDNKDKKIRDDAARAFNEILEKHISSAEAEMNAILLNKKVNDEIRGFKRPDEARHLEDDIESEIVDSLINAVSSNFDLAKRFYELKSKLLGLEKLEYHERNLEYGSIDKEYPYEESVNLIYKVLNKLDSEFGEIFKKFVEEGYIDVYPKKGKSSGAFCAHILKSQPTYILLNYSNRLRDVEILAHETGHGINNELMKDKQNSLNFGTPKSTAEVASTFMEDFILEELMNGADEETRLALMMQKLNGDISSIFRQSAFYMFETELHNEFREKGYLSKEEIGKIFRKYMESYMGEGVEQSEGSENWWVYIPHFRMFFYVYSYVSGLIISKSLQRKVKENPKFIEKVKEFLSSGTSISPKDIFLKIGLDISKKEFWEEGIKEVESLLNKTEELAKKLGKI